MPRSALFAGIAVVAAARGATGLVGAPLPPAAPLEPIAAVLRAFESHPIVALADNPHGSEQVHAFRVSLVRSPGFAETVNDIVVEFGNARYQAEVDRFVRGDDVPQQVLRKVWQNTTQVTAVWDHAIYEDFYRVVRDVNAALPPERRIRVLLGDPPVDWERGPEDAGRWTPRRTEYAARVIINEVLAKHRRALVIYGGGHLVRTRQSIVGRVESETRSKVFTVTTLHGRTRDWVTSAQSSVAGWQAPSLATLAGTLLHQQDLVYWDAALYLGPTTSFSQIPRHLCADRAYVSMRLERLAVIGQGADRSFRAECALSR